MYVQHAFNNSYRLTWTHLSYANVAIKLQFSNYVGENRLVAASCYSKLIRKIDDDRPDGAIISYEN